MNVPLNSQEFEDIVRGFKDDTAKFLANANRPSADVLPCHQVENNFKVCEPVKLSPTMPQLRLF